MCLPVSSRMDVRCESLFRERGGMEGKWVAFGFGYLSLSDQLPDHNSLQASASLSEVNFPCLVADSGAEKVVWGGDRLSQHLFEG